MVSLTENIIAFAWEPVGNKFAIIQGENPRIAASIYQVMDKEGAAVNIISEYRAREEG